MKPVLLAVTLGVFAGPAFASDVGISINVKEPGLYGQISIGDAPKPEVIYAQPVIVRPEPSPAPVEPIYLHVPPGYERHWRRHCHEYHACGRPVYFVREQWYQDHYHHRHDEHHGGKDEPHDARAEERHDRDHMRGPRDDGYDDRRD